MFTPQYEPTITEDYIKAVSDQMRTGWVGPSKKTEDLESKIKSLTRSKYCVSTTSGTMALVLAIHSLGLKRKSTILFPSYTFLAGANAARFLGYNIKLVDIKEDTLCMDPDKIDITKDVSAIMFVNHNAYVGEDVERVKQICNKHELVFIEDSSQAIGMKNAGKTGDVGVFSFSVPKLVTTGQGGVLFTDLVSVDRRAREMRDHGDNWRKTKTHNLLGVNLKFNDIAAAYGLSQLDRLDELLKLRKTIFDWYREDIKLIDFGYDSSWMVLYRTKKCAEIIKALADKEIQAVQYYRPINTNPPYYSENAYPVAQKIYDEVLYLPSSLNLTKEKIKEITQVITSIDPA